MMKEYAAYDNLPAKQSRWEISLHNARDLSWMQQAASDKSSVGHTCWARQLTFSFNGRTDFSATSRYFQK